MRIVNANDNLHLDKCVVALGNFDGVHIAHQNLIKKCVKIAHDNSLISAVYIFSKHPQEVLGKKVELLTLNSEKEILFEKLGVDVLIYQDPDVNFLNISPEDFLINLINRFNVSAIVVGKHYTFGKNAAGDAEVLSKFSLENDVNVYILPLEEKNNQIISSSSIRTMILNGDITAANELIGREFELSGFVEHGNHIGTELGFPTMNIHFYAQKIIPKFGVYACNVLVDNASYNGIANIGIKPTVDGTTPLVEVNIFDKNGNFYGKKISVKLLKFIRPEKKFSDIHSLKSQISADVCAVKEYFSQFDR